LFAAGYQPPTDSYHKENYMRTTRCGLVGAILSAVFLIGCTDEQPKSDNLTQPTDTSQLKGMLGDQMKNAKIQAKVPEK